MKYDFYFPELGEGLFEGYIVAYLVKEGEHVVEDQPLVEVQTDKVTTVLPSPVVTNLLAHKERLKRNKGVNVTLTPIFVKALSQTLHQFTLFNSNDQNGSLKLFSAHNIGIAVDTQDGVVIPNIKQVNEKSVDVLADEINELIDRARSKKMFFADSREGTITISNVGAIGGGFATPIIFYPQVSNISLYRADKKVVVTQNDEIVVR
ncbi:hypothetical protein HMI46_12325 [Paenibacillus alvei]|uniref:2-oxoacid dehydrogenase acyltransferase catalytic domain-containing protein n=1 Tax=Paenibacillus alvei TaxID=44250 RepID=A0AAP6ZYT9_PAEAL|nr:hypothetical protein [Paenibacillus alvei]